MDRLVNRLCRERFAVRWLDHKGQTEAADALRRFEGPRAPANDLALDPLVSLASGAR